MTQVQVADEFEAQAPSREMNAALLVLGRVLNKRAQGLPDGAITSARVEALSTFVEGLSDEQFLQLADITVVGDVASLIAGTEEAKMLNSVQGTKGN